jgi:Fe-S-cluster containining protein
LKKREGKRVSSKTKPNVLQDIKFLKHDEKFRFECSLCGECCRNTAILLETYDLYRLAGYLRQTGFGVRSIEDMLTEYAGILVLEDSNFPVVMLNTPGDENKKECVFLNNGRCSVYKGRPKVCRLHPLGAWPNKTLNGFDYFIPAQKQRHFKGPALLAKDWIDANFSEKEKKIEIEDIKWTRRLFPIMRRLQKIGVAQDQILSPLIRLKYVSFDLDKPFLPQLACNMDLLKQELIKLCGRSWHTFFYRFL